MAFPPPLRNPANFIVPHPCGERAEDQNWNEIINILNEFYNYINSAGITFIGSAVAVVEAHESCVPDPVQITGFELWGDGSGEIEDIDVPTEVSNWLAMPIADGDHLFLGYKGAGEWRVCEVTHRLLECIVNLDKTGEGIVWDNFTFGGLFCANLPGGAIPTVRKNVIYALDTSYDLVSCLLTSSQREIEVFESTDDPNAYVEMTFSPVTVMTDLAQLSPSLDIYGYFYYVWVPCAASAGTRLLLEVDPCIAAS